MQEERVSYITNAELLEQFKIMEETGKVPDDLHFMFLKMAEKIANKGCFCNYTYIEDMIQEAYVRCVHYANRFDSERPNPFAYFTTVIHHSFIAHIKKEKNYQSKKWNELNNHIMQLESEYNIQMVLTEDVKEKLYSNSAVFLKEEKIAEELDDNKNTQESEEE
jgi:RNA polymerase sigma factor (sigma-70 family)